MMQTKYGRNVKGKIDKIANSHPHVCSWLSGKSLA